MSEQHVVKRLDALHAPILAFRAFPLNGSENEPTVRAVHVAAATLAKLNEAAGDTDPALTPNRRSAAVHERHKEVLKAMEVARTAIAADERRTEKAAREFYLPAAADATQAPLDSDLRRYYGNAQPEERGQLDRAMASGNAPELLSALARFPAGADAQRARDQYRSRQRIAFPAEAATLDAAPERIDWAKNVVGQVGEALDAAVHVIGPGALVQA